MGNPNAELLLRHGFESVKHLVIAVMFQVIMGPVMKIIINLNFFNDVYRERELPLDMTYSYIHILARDPKARFHF